MERALPPRLVRWEHKRPQRGRGTLEEMGQIRRPKSLLFEKAMHIRQIVPTKFGKFKSMDKNIKQPPILK